MIALSDTGMESESHRVGRQEEHGMTEKRLCKGHEAGERKKADRRNGEGE